jgi:monoterpene epsilon-lactone hydrolase
MDYVMHDDGSAELRGRVVPVPATISAQARQSLIDAAKRPSAGEVSIASRRSEIDAQMQLLNDIAARLYPVDIEEIAIDGVRCHRIRPAGVETTGKVLVNLHGGAFTVGSGSLVEAIPLAVLTHSTVLAVDYRLAPEHPYPAAVDDVTTVWRQVVRHHAPADVALYGTSAGGFLTAQAVMRFQRDGLPMPVCCGIFSGGGDLTDLGDTAAIFNFGGFAGEPLLPFDHPASDTASYLRDANQDDPVVSPLRADLAGFPPTLLVSSTRDAVLSATASMHRALLRADVDASLVVFEALPHGFWFNLGLPETLEALDVMSRFFARHLGIDVVKAAR